MNSIEFPDREAFTSVEMLVLEDQRTELDQLKELLEMLPGANVIPTDEYDFAKARIEEGRCGLFVTDLRIDTPPEGRRTNAKRLLARIQNMKLFIPSVATSAFHDDLNEVRKEKLATTCVTKAERSHLKVQPGDAQVAGGDSAFTRLVL